MIGHLLHKKWIFYKNEKIAGFLFMFMGIISFVAGISSFESSGVNTEGTCRSICGLLLIVESLFDAQISTFIQSILLIAFGSVCFLWGVSLQRKDNL